MTYLSKLERDRLIAAGLIAFPEPGTGQVRSLPGKSGAPRRTIGALGRAGDPPKTVEQANAAIDDPSRPPLPFGAVDMIRLNGQWIPIFRDDSQGPSPSIHIRPTEVVIQERLEEYIAAIEAARVSTIAMFGDGTVPLGVRTGFDTCLEILRAKRKAS